MRNPSVKDEADRVLGRPRPIASGTSSDIEGLAARAASRVCAWFRGTTANSRVSNVGFSRVRSVTIGKGVWELCEDVNYRGRCVKLDKSVPDLSAYGLTGYVRSVRPARVEPR